MGIKERMMDGMMDKMPPEEKLEAMETMMQKFLEGFSPEEKKKLMEGMMEKFMSGLSAEERGSLMAGMMPRMMGEAGPMGMLRRMMGGGKGAETGGEMPWDMCRKMLGAMTEGAQTARFATPEVRGLFDEWAA